MATIILGTVGRIFGGPIGGIIGTALGGFVDRGVFGGGGRPRDVGRIGNLGVQSAAYGEPIAFMTGRMRAAGNLLWTSGIKESTARSGGGKRSGPATTTYSYSASFAVGLAGRQIAGIGRVWADGKLIRDSSGSFLTPVVMRLHGGSDAQPTDPLIAAFEGAAGTPAYRGIAYAVFENMPLADYGNRIPNLTFEIIADAAPSQNAGDVIAALATVRGRSLLAVSGNFPEVAGHFSGRSGSVAEAVAPLIEMSGASLAGLAVVGGGGAVFALPEADCHSQVPGEARNHERRKRAGGDSLVGAVEVAFYDTSRDYQPGLQRARRDGDVEGGGTDHQSVACAMTPVQAKALAAAILARSHTGRLRTNVRLPWRYLTVLPGTRVSLGDDAATWRVREARFEAFVVHLDLERIDALAVAPATSDGGRALVFVDQPAGPTTLALLDLPILPGDVPTAPRIWAAASGHQTGWRRAGIETSGDDGATYTTAGLVEAGAVQGTAVTRLGAGNVDSWDRFSSVDVLLLSDAMWLESRSAASVLAGANLAMVGAEIIQFADVEALSPRRFRLSGLLRGRRGTEAAVGNHGAGEAFVLLDLPSLLPIDPPADALGRAYRARATGVGDAAFVPVVVTITGRALRPLSPAHLALAAVNGTVAAQWIRRSRTGFGWTDFVDAPLGEAAEAYRVEVSLDGRVVRRADVAAPGFTYSVADRASDGGGSIVTIAVAQFSAAVGPGDAARATLTLI